MILRIIIIPNINFMSFNIDFGNLIKFWFKIKFKKDKCLLIDDQKGSGF